MKNKILSIWAVVLPALLAPVWGADVLGKWIAKEPSSLNESLPTTYQEATRLSIFAETVFSFKVDGTTLTGTVFYPQGETVISEGKIKGDEISFVVVRRFGENEIKLVYEGKVELNEIKFTREVQGGKGKPQAFVAKREFQRNNGFVPVPTAVPVQPPPDPVERKIRLPDK